MTKKLKIVAVDVCTVSQGDVDLSPLQALGDTYLYDVLTPLEVEIVARDADILLVNKADVTRKLLDVCKNIKYVGTFSTGYNNIDIDACREKNVIVCNVPSYSTNAVCQHTFSMLLMFLGSTQKYVQSVSDGDWKKSYAFCYLTYPLNELYGKTFGIFGYGSIGSAVAKVATAFGANVIVHSRRHIENLPYRQVDMDTLFKESDILSLHCPLNESTKGVINESTLKKMKSSAILINTARGGLIDEVALSNALKNGVIRGALLDTLTSEPMRDTPLYNLDNCLITPHIAWGATETRERLVNIVVDNVRHFINNDVQNRVV